MLKFAHGLKYPIYMVNCREKEKGKITSRSEEWLVRGREGQAAKAIRVVQIGVWPLGFWDLDVGDLC